MNEEQIKALQTQVTEMTNQLKATQEKAAGVDELVAKARKEEKDKLYEQINKFKELATAHEAKVKELEQALSANPDAKELETKIAAKETEVAELTKQIAELNEKLAKGAENTVDNEELKKLLAGQEAMQKLIQEQAEKIASIEAEKAAEAKAKEVASYKAEKLKGLEEIFHSFVQGSTKEEIDASFEQAKTAHENMIKKLGYQNLKPTNLANEEVFKDKSPEEISRMTPQEYAEWRKGLVQAGVLKK